MWKCSNLWKCWDSLLKMLKFSVKMLTFLEKWITRSEPTKIPKLSILSPTNQLPNISFSKSSEQLKCLRKHYMIWAWRPHRKEIHYIKTYGPVVKRSVSIHARWGMMSRSCPFRTDNTPIHYISTFDLHRNGPHRRKWPWRRRQLHIFMMIAEMLWSP